MNVILKLKQSNFENKKIVPEIFSAKLEGTKVLKITTIIDLTDIYQNPESLTFYYDLKNIFFEDEHFVIEGIISNDKEVIGRCVFSVNEPSIYT